MKLNLIQKAFMGHGRKLYFATKFRPLFECSLEQLTHAANQVAKQLPVLRAVEVEGSVTLMDSIVGYRGHIRDHYKNAGTICITEEDGCYWIGFSHEFLDGWSYTLAFLEFFRIVRGGDIGVYRSQLPIGKILPIGNSDLKLCSFSGTVGEADCRIIPISGKYISTAKSKGMRVPDYIGEVACSVLGDINIISSKLLADRQADIGHYSIYGYGGMVNGEYRITVSHENLTRNMIARGISDKLASCFVTSIPLGNPELEVVDFYQRLGPNNLGRIQPVSSDGKHVLQVALNKSLDNRDLLFDKLSDMFA